MNFLQTDLCMHLIILSVSFSSERDGNLPSNILSFFNSSIHLQPEARGGSREEQPHARGQGQWLGGPTPRPTASAEGAHEGLEELSHIEGQEGRR